jgi:hypothetical protein
MVRGEGIGEGRGDCVSNSGALLENEANYTDRSRGRAAGLCMCVHILARQYRGDRCTEDRSNGRELGSRVDQVN